MAKIIRTSYTGDNFREFLQKRGITYKAAAADLKIDKNTIGKAVRGGNLNIGVLLSWRECRADRFLIFLRKRLC